jgi:hypothetical protein
MNSHVVNLIICFSAFISMDNWEYTIYVYLNESSLHCPEIDQWENSKQSQTVIELLDHPECC